MGKRGSWFSAIKKVFSSHTKDTKLGNEVAENKKSAKEKRKKGLRHGESSSFIPFGREPSSIEKILDEAEREHKLIFRPPTPPFEQPRTPTFLLPPPRAASPSIRIPSQRITSPRVASPRVASPRVVSPRAASSNNIHREKGKAFYRPEPTLRNHNASATKIQAAYRGYVARRSFRALKGLVRLQGVIRGQSVKRQTVNAMKYMQLLVRVQSQIQSRRIQMLENQVRRQAELRNNKDVDSQFGKWSQYEAGQEDWDDSLLTKEEMEARLQRKVEAIVKRERAMAYAYSHQLWKSTPNGSAVSGITDIRSNGFPWWWNWLERQIPSATTPESQAWKNFQITPPRPHSEIKPSPRPASRQQQQFAFDGFMDTPTPRSTKSAAYVPTRHLPTPAQRTPQGSSIMSKYSRARAAAGAESPYDLPLKDDDSLMSCPPFSAPNYMAPTASAKAKVRTMSSSNKKERFSVGTPLPSNERRRLSFPLTQGIGSFKWNKGSFLFSNKDTSSTSRGGLDNHQTLQSIGNLSVDSTVSMPATAGRKPFNRFV